MLLPRNSPQSTCLFCGPTQERGATAGGQVEGCRTLHGSHAKRHQQRVPYTHT